MQALTPDNLTATVLHTLAKAKDPRLKEVLSSLIRHLHEFVKEVDLTPDEWISAIEFLCRVGEKTSPDRNEFILASDVLGVSSLVDIVNHQNTAGTTNTSLLGPFYIDGARMPTLSVGGDLIGENDGEPMVVTGRVLTPKGAPISGALLEIWQNAANGLYESEDTEQPEGNLRCRMLTDSAGHYHFTTIKPVAYTVPADGPVGELLHAAGRHAWRPAHIHFKVSANGYRPLITELYIADDPYIEEDAVFGVRDSLVVAVRWLETAAEAAPYKGQPGYGLVEFDFGLHPTSQA